ncbi:MAG TPA: 3-oxoacyl-[acyl-carrier-protein] reductase, partial [Lachnospiraceae bacterium]|nr:3-oxoacyl-[acyl-carrier-protein] reductase [Lachnospiraceae bacterium]
MRFLNKIAVVTGAAQGIGAAIAKRFCEENIEKVYLLDMNFKKTDMVAKNIDPSGNHAVALACNVADRKEVNEVFNEILQ